MEGWQQPVSISLGLLPSGPDPVGEQNACTNLPGRYMVGLGRKGNPPHSVTIDRGNSLAYLVRHECQTYYNFAG